VARLCDRIVVIAHGRVVADGTPDKLRGHWLRQPEDARRAIGSDGGCSHGGAWIVLQELPTRPRPSHAANAFVVMPRDP
jgi:hypothetical protein